MKKKTDSRERIVVALDVGGRTEALRLISRLEEAKIFKVGMELFTAEGPPFLEDVRRLGKKVFLDLKYHDIPNTAAGAVKAAARHGVFMLTIHASGGKEMLARAVEAAKEEAGKRGIEAPLLLGVTVLTSLKDEHLGEIGFRPPVLEQVLRLSRLAREAGLDGVVCSPQEIEMIRRETGEGFLVVTPGIRPAGSEAQDQKRIMTPAEALRKGADYLVVGRPITGDPSPDKAFLKIVEELEHAHHATEGE